MKTFSRPKKNEIMDKIMTIAQLLVVLFCLPIFGVNFPSIIFTICCIIIPVTQILIGGNWITNLLLKLKSIHHFILWFCLGALRIGVAKLAGTNFYSHYWVTIMFSIPFLISALYGYLKKLENDYMLISKAYQKYEKQIGQIFALLMQLSILTMFSIHHIYNGDGEDYNFSVGLNIVLDSILVYLVIHVAFFIFIILLKLDNNSKKINGLFPWKPMIAISAYFLSEGIQVIFHHYARIELYLYLAFGIFVFFVISILLRLNKYHYFAERRRTLYGTTGFLILLTLYMLVVNYLESTGYRTVDIQPEFASIFSVITFLVLIFTLIVVIVCSYVLRR